jgi:hypothetical protein
MMTRTPRSRYQKQKPAGFFDRLIPESAISTEFLLGAGGAVSLIDGCLLLSPAGFTGIFGSMVMAVMILFSATGISHSPAVLWIKKFTSGRYAKPAILGILFLASFAFLAFALSIEPSHAIFFQNAEKFARNMVTKGTTTTGTDVTAATATSMTRGVSFIFNALRFMFIIYIGAGLVNIVKAANENEDWKSAARTPAIIIMIVILGDMIAEFIIGDGSATAP